jgi:hypothetical protein
MIDTIAPYSAETNSWGGGGDTSVVCVVVVIPLVRILVLTVMIALNVTNADGELA